MKYICIIFKSDNNTEWPINVNLPTTLSSTHNERHNHTQKSGFEKLRKNGKKFFHKTYNLKGNKMKQKKKKSKIDSTMKKKIGTYRKKNVCFILVHSICCYRGFKLLRHRTALTYERKILTNLILMQNVVKAQTKH